MKYELTKEQFTKLWNITSPDYDFHYRYDRHAYWREVYQPKYKLKYMETGSWRITHISGEQKHIDWFLLQL